MEKAVLKTLIYADIFDYPLKINEVHRWLIGRKVSLRKVEQALKKLNQESRIKNQGEYYFLKKRNRLIARRRQREKQSATYFRKAKIIVYILKIIPWIKLIGISGGLALNNASLNDDIDFFIITSKNRLWISRLFILGLLTFIGQRRKRVDKNLKVAGKICINILLEEDELEQDNKDIYIAHEILQMKVVWQRENIYSKYLEDNLWAFKFLPNWIDKSVKGSKYYVLRDKIKSKKYPHDTLNIIERLAQRFQLWYMKSPSGKERIENGALYFHPNDCRQKILLKYKQRLKTRHIK